eukprot:16918-Prorocentrum_minimum.AAC.2
MYADVRGDVSRVCADGHAHGQHARAVRGPSPDELAPDGPPAGAPDPPTPGEAPQPPGPGGRQPGLQRGLPTSRAHQRPAGRQHVRLNAWGRRGVTKGGRISVTPPPGHESRLGCAPGGVPTGGPSRQAALLGGA